MAIVLRNTHVMLPPIVAAHNAVVAQIGPGSNSHLDKSEARITLADATTEATGIALTNEITAVLAFHFADLLGHKAADTATLGTPGAKTLGAAQTALNANKTAYNAHIALTTKHYAADETNAVDTADAADEATLIALANALKAALHAHMDLAAGSASIRLVDA